MQHVPGASFGWLKSYIVAPLARAASEVAGVADPSPQAEAYARENGFALFTDTEALLDKTRPDGVIVATPTGTTAYSFSVRGPIASPALRCLVLTPVSPHMLFDRSLVLADSEELGFVVCDDRGVVLTLDGRELGDLGAGDRVNCRAAREPLRLASLRARDFHQVLKAKFDLPDR